MPKLIHFFSIHIQNHILNKERRHAGVAKPLSGVKTHKKINETSVVEGVQATRLMA
jgi:hypothetical protein